MYNVIESGGPISAIIEVSAEEFYGKGYEDSESEDSKTLPKPAPTGWELDGR